MKWGAILCVFGIYWYLVLDVTGATPTNFLIIQDFAVSANVSLIPFADMQSVMGQGLVQIVYAAWLSAPAFLAGVAPCDARHWFGLCSIAVH